MGWAAVSVGCLNTFLCVTALLGARRCRWRGGSGAVLSCSSASHVHDSWCVPGLVLRAVHVHPPTCPPRLKSLGVGGGLPTQGGEGAVLSWCRRWVCTGWGGAATTVAAGLLACPRGAGTHGGGWARNVAPFPWSIGGRGRAGRRWTCRVHCTANWSVATHPPLAHVGGGSRHWHALPHSDVIGRRHTRHGAKRFLCVFEARAHPPPSTHARTDPPPAVLTNPDPTFGSDGAGPDLGFRIQDGCAAWLCTCTCGLARGGVDLPPRSSIHAIMFPSFLAWSASSSSHRAALGLTQLCGEKGAPPISCLTPAGRGE